MFSTEAARFDIMDAQRFDISRRGSCSFETPATNSTQDPLDSDHLHFIKSESSRGSLMDAQRYDHSKRCSESSSVSGSLSPDFRVALSSAIDTEAVIERLVLEAERLRMLDSQRYDPRSRTNSPEPSERITLGSKLITLVTRDESDSGSSYGFTSDSPSGFSHSPDTSEVAESVSDAASSIRFANPKNSGDDSRLASSWRTGHTITTRTVIHPVGRKTTASKSTTPLFTPPTSRPISPKGSRTILRSLNCLSDEAQSFDRHRQTEVSASKPLTIFVTQQVENPISDEQREREQLWREAMCSLHFGGDWEQMNKRFPPGQPRW
ncbi:hypothetical protein J3R30DRAFT_1090490 [Lentinula aciculospora]|uniref:Uncharacterized protein n=1 Tax=Lentinula aciculospora TaxID=153920 RepID=A0A9W9DHY6_9AGAR|nr:hypothetical protein J3R30DRAFT_1090490 [Lentinula aciculospora]